MHNIDVMLAKRAARLRAQYNFRVPDALQLSTALEHAATLFVTNGRRLARITELSVLILDDFL
jgi:predicted nucleic acid-binding protein